MSRGFHRVGSAGTGRDRLTAASPRGPRAPPDAGQTPDGERRAARSSGGAALLTAPSAPAGAGQVPAGKGARSGARSAERSAALPRDGREGGAPRGQRPRPPAEGAEEGEGEEERGGAAVLHGRHLRREERSRHPPTRPARTRWPRGFASGRRAAASIPLPSQVSVPKDAGGQRGRDGGAAARGQGELASPKATPGPVRGAAVPQAQRLKR